MGDWTEVNNLWTVVEEAEVLNHEVAILLQLAFFFHFAFEVLS